MNGNGPPSSPLPLSGTLGFPPGIGDGTPPVGTSSASSKPTSTQKNPFSGASIKSKSRSNTASLQSSFSGVSTKSKSRSVTPSAELKNGKNQLPPPKASSKRARVVKRGFEDTSSEYTAGDLGSDVMSNVSLHPAKKSRNDFQEKRHQGDNLVCILDCSRQFCLTHQPNL